MLLSASLMLLNGFAAQTIFAAQSAQVTFTIGIRDIYPPNQITDLEAAASSSAEGEVMLIWTAPAEDNLPAPSQTPVSKYVIKYSTNSVPDLAGNTTSWWDQASTAAFGITPQPSGNAESVVITGLDHGVQYYFAMKSIDDTDNISLIDINAQDGPQSFAATLDMKPPTVTGVGASATSESITLAWNPSTATDVTSYRIYWDSSAPADVFTATATVEFPQTSHTFTNVTMGNSYYFYVTAIDSGAPFSLGNALESDPSTVVSALPLIALPAAPLNLAGIAGSTGSITWQWQDTSVNETGFRLYTSTGGLMGQAGASPGTGSNVQITETGLVPGSSYTRIIRSHTDAAESADSVSALFHTLANPPTNTIVTDVTPFTLSLAWQPNGNGPSTIYEVWYSTDSAFGVKQSTLTPGLSKTLDTLASNTTYYAQVRSVNGGGTPSIFDASVSTQTPPERIRDLSAVGGYREVSLSWKAVSDPLFTNYNIYRTLDPASAYVLLSTTSAQDYKDAGLTNGVTYYYRVSFSNLHAHESPYESAFSRARKTVRPQQPSGIKGALNSTGTFTLSWTPVTVNMDGSAEPEIAGYRIYKSSSFEGPFTVRDVVSPNTSSWISPDSVPPAVWYMLDGYDTSDNVSDQSMMVEASREMRIVKSAPDHSMNVFIPAEEAKVFYSATNNRSEDVVMSIDRLDSEEKGNILTSYEVKVFGAISHSEIKEFKFAKPTTELRFRYTYGSGQSPAKHATGFRAMSFRALPGSPKNVGIFWNNSIEFVRLGGSVDEAEGIVSMKTSRPVGIFQVRQVARSGEFQILQMTPRKIFTPNGDGVNDEIIIFLDNPNDTIISQAKIFDITGAEVADFQQGIVAGQLGIVSLKWNGRGKDGQIVKSGIYLYQIQAEGKILNGTMVVAR